MSKWMTDNVWARVSRLADLHPEIQEALLTDVEYRIHGQWYTKVEGGFKAVGKADAPIMKYPFDEVDMIQKNRRPTTGSSGSVNEGAPSVQSKAKWTGKGSKRS